MLQPCQDNYSTTFASYEGMRRYHEKESLESRWHRCRVNELHIEPLDKASPLYGTPSAFAAGISAESVEDTAENLGLAMRVDGSYYPVRSTAYKSLLDRAKISGSALPKLSRQRLASVLNDCLELYSSETLLLIRDEKISAAHSGDSMDYSVLPIDELLKVLTKKLDDRFPGSMFQGGYRDHSLSSASWTMPGQKEDLLGAYAKLLASQGKPTLAAKLVPAIRFVTSDTGIASAKVSAMLEGTQHPIHIGSCIAVDHRRQSKVEDFEAALDQLFAQFGDSVARLQKPRNMVLLTEGPMKADVIHYLTGQTVLAVAGVNSLTQLELILPQLHEQGVERIMTAFDMDFMENPHVQGGYRTLVSLLSDAGFRYGTYLWDPRYKGLDDYVWEHCFQRQLS